MIARLTLDGDQVVDLVPGDEGDAFIEHADGLRTRLQLGVGDDAVAVFVSDNGGPSGEERTLGFHRLTVGSIYQVGKTGEPNARIEVLS